MKKLLIIPLLAVMLAVGCAGTKLEPGGAYAPTNSVGQVVYNDVGLAIADSAYRLSYETTASVFKFERDNRIALWKISPDIKHGLDQARRTAVEVDKRWALARQTYKANPTPENLNTIQTILQEIQRLLVVVQNQIKPAYTKITP